MVILFYFISFYFWVVYYCLLYIYIYLGGSKENFFLFFFNFISKLDMFLLYLNSYKNYLLKVAVLYCVILFWWLNKFKLYKKRTSNLYLWNFLIYQHVLVCPFQGCYIVFVTSFWMWGLPYERFLDFLKFFYQWVCNGSQICKVNNFRNSKFFKDKYPFF